MTCERLLTVPVNRGRDLHNLHVLRSSKNEDVSCSLSQVLCVHTFTVNFSLLECAYAPFQVFHAFVMTEPVAQNTLGGFETVHRLLGALFACFFP